MIVWQGIGFLAIILAIVCYFAVVKMLPTTFAGHRVPGPPLVVLLGSLAACYSVAGLAPRTFEAFAQGTEQATPPSLPSKLEGHYEGTKLDFHQDYGSSYQVAIDLELEGKCLYSDPTAGGKLPCHWERSADGIVVSVTINPFINTPSVWTLSLRWADNKLSYLSRDGIGGGVCIQLAKDKAVADCHGMMMGMPAPHPPTPLR